jgi:two-component system sensor histidine kinase AlgZ
MTSIRHFPATHPLPDWRNFGVMLRVLLGINSLWHCSRRWRSRPIWLAGWGVTSNWRRWSSPGCCSVWACWRLSRDALWRFTLRTGQALVLLLAGGLAFGLYAYWQSLALSDAGSAWRSALLAMAAAAIMLGYFELRARGFSPAQTEARLAALNARIRPHFLFNSLNAVLSLIRARPQQAEEALESLSDLFRAAMRDPASLVSLADEIALSKQYLELEKLRLGDRLAVNWEIGPVSLDLPIPPLMLQPLLENAVYHGIEPAPEGGTVRIAIAQHGDELVIAIANPTAGHLQHAAGNQIAVGNIRERLALYYDLEARLEIEAAAHTYEVRIVLPCRQKAL